MERIAGGNVGQEGSSRRGAGDRAAHLGWAGGGGQDGRCAGPRLMNVRLRLGKSHGSDGDHAAGCARRRCGGEGYLLEDTWHCLSGRTSRGQTGGDDRCERSAWCEASRIRLKVLGAYGRDTGGDYSGLRQTTAWQLPTHYSAPRRKGSRTPSSKRTRASNSTASTIY